MVERVASSGAVVEDGEKDSRYVQRIIDGGWIEHCFSSMGVFSMIVFNVLD